MESKKISEFTRVTALTGNDEFLVIDVSETTGVNATNVGTPVKISLSALTDALISRKPQDGLKGYPGAKGQTGSFPSNSGDTGPRGQTGEPGLQGDRGQNGEDGEDGDVGEKGVAGSSGPQGIQGEPGPKGNFGDTGNDGTKGSKGYSPSVNTQALRGPKGNKGVVGTMGHAGTKGKKGIPGNSTIGIKGQRGNIGDSSFGTTGDTGDTGDKGTDGVKGYVGPIGISYKYNNSPKRTLILPNGDFSHARHLLESKNLPRDVYSYEWESQILTTSSTNSPDYSRRFLVFELDENNFSDYSYSKYNVEVDFESVITDGTSPVLTKTTLATTKNNTTYGTVGLDWYEDDNGNHHVMFFSVSPTGTNVPLLIKRAFVPYGTDHVGSKNLDNFRI